MSRTSCRFAAARNQMCIRMPSRRTVGSGAGHESSQSSTINNLLSLKARNKNFLSCVRLLEAQNRRSDVQVHTRAVLISCLIDETKPKTRKGAATFQTETEEVRRFSRCSGSRRPDTVAPDCGGRRRSCFTRPTLNEL
ncbi:uncharacterized [Tachysurus ichikawai]